MNDFDIWRSANRLVDLYGDDASIHADELLEREDLDGAGTWRRVLDAVRELELTVPGDAVH